MSLRKLRWIVCGKCCDLAQLVHAKCFATIHCGYYSNICIHSKKYSQSFLQLKYSTKKFTWLKENQHQKEYLKWDNLRFFLERKPTWYLTSKWLLALNKPISSIIFFHYIILTSVSLVSDQKVISLHEARCCSSIFQKLVQEFLIMIECLWILLQ